LFKTIRLRIIKWCGHVAHMRECRFVIETYIEGHEFVHKEIRIVRNKLSICRLDGLWTGMNIKVFLDR
jgi:hypothetical protein